MPNGVGTAFATIGLCDALGAKKAAVVGAGIGGLGGAITGYLIAKEKGTMSPTTGAVAGGVAGAGLGAVGGYLTCRGVRAGIPLVHR